MDIKFIVGAIILYFYVLVGSLLSHLFIAAFSFLAVRKRNIIGYFFFLTLVFPIFYLIFLADDPFPAPLAFVAILAIMAPSILVLYTGWCALFGLIKAWAEENRNAPNN
jgi:hypothetical protein